MNYIEKSLFEKTKDYQEGQIYTDQWKFAKSYLPKVLDTISHVFPHYSLHNSIHSEAILNNIVRILGEESIDKLSIVDLWLLLASAYYHDCGMVVSGEDKIELLKVGSAFVNYVKDIIEDSSSSLYPYASLFEIKDNSIIYKNKMLTPETYEGARFLLADFIRSQHAERSSKRIETEQSLHFPGDPIPERIIRILKSICDCHTKDISEVMKLQPVESSGCGTEDCHPRFVAAMLRLGDLLDVDSNRISEVLLSTLGSIPSDSKFYNKTNRSISHIRIDQSVIEITAECEDYQVADLINRWLQWLNDELVFYMKQWHKIIPFNSFGYLPTVGDLKVELLNYDTFDGKKRPSFEIDSNKAIELLQGAGLYTDSFECIRELLQNAVDATYLRVYKENPGICNLKLFKEKCAQYPVVVKLNRISSSRDIETTDCWKVEIQDRGIGMTKDDLSFLSRTGSSENNTEKKKLIQSVPEVLWPSGAFGIGFQSVFLITDKVNIVTRKYNKDYYINAELFNPSGKDKGAILVKSINKDDMEVGTRVIFEFEDMKDGRQMITHEDKYAISEYFSFDFAKHKNVNLMGKKILDEIVRFAAGTFIPVEFYLDGEKKKYISQKTKIEFGDIYEETGMQIFVEKPGPSTGGYVESKIYYRNQWIRYCHESLPFLSFHINILKGRAKDILSLSRNNIRQEYYSTLNENARKTIIWYLNKKIDSFDLVRKQLASMFIEMHRDFMLEKGIEGIRERDYWKSYEVALKNNNTKLTERMSLDGLLSAKSIERIINNVDDDILLFEIGENKYALDIDYGGLYWINRFIMLMAKRLGFYLMFKKDGYVYKKEKCDILEESLETKEEMMYNYLKKDESARSLFPCPEKYDALRIKNGSFSKYKNISSYLDYPCMICPYVRKYDIEHKDEAISLSYEVDSVVVNTVYDNREDDSVTKEQIKEAYLSFKKEWEPVIERVNARAKKEPVDIYRSRRFHYFI